MRKPMTGKGGVMSARSLNKVMLMGNLTRDPELRYTPSGTAVCTFGIATNRSWTTADGGETQEETEFHRVVAWSKLAEICSQLLFKGRKVYVEGRLQTRKWTGQDGQERQTTEIVIDEMIALGAPRGRQGNGFQDDQGEYSDEEFGQAATSDQSVGQVEDESTIGQAGVEEEVESKTKKKPASQDEEVDVDDIPF